MWGKNSSKIFGWATLRPSSEPLLVLRLPFKAPSWEPLSQPSPPTTRVVGGGKRARPPPPPPGKNFSRRPGLEVMQPSLTPSSPSWSYPNQGFVVCYRNKPYPYTGVPD